MSENPTYFAVIPASVRYDNRLKPNAKLLFAEMTVLTNKEGYCWASNGYFAKLYNVDSHTISKWVSQLADCGHISVELTYKENSKEVDKRIIRLITPIFDNGGATLKSGGYGQKSGGGMDEKQEDNNTRVNNTSINISSSDSKEQKTLIKREDLFNLFWLKYDKHVEKSNTIKHWNKLTEEERIKLLDSLPIYIKARPDKQYRSHPHRYIRDKLYEDYLVAKPSTNAFKELPVAK